METIQRTVEVDELTYNNTSHMLYGSCDGEEVVTAEGWQFSIPDVDADELVIDEDYTEVTGNFVLVVEHDRWVDDEGNEHLTTGHIKEIRSVSR